MELAGTLKTPHPTRFSLGGVKNWAREAFRHSVECSPWGDRILWRLPETVSAQPPTVALTFDDGPDPEQTPRILDLLGEAGVRATFFLLGTEALHHPELVQRLCAEGHAIGNHTHTHAHCRQLRGKALRRELEFADVALRVACPEVGTPVFRPPFGELRALQAVDLAHRGRSIVFWNRDSRDYRGATAGEIRSLGETLRHRDILLMHDRFPATVAALPELIARLQDRGFQTVTLNQAAFTQSAQSVEVA